MSQFLDVPSVSPLGDGNNWRHNKPFRYISTLLGAIVESPVNRVTDFTSSPQAIWNIVPNWGIHGPAALAHDEAYWTQVHSREASDDMLREAMELLAVAPALITKIHMGVRLFGQHAWDRNAELKASGYTRLASGEDDPPFASPIL